METEILNLPIHTAVTLGFYLIAIVYILFTAILYYHWEEYSVEPTVTRTTMIAYLVTTIPLIFIMGIITIAI